MKIKLTKSVLAILALALNVLSANAYTTLATSTYYLTVGETKYLPVPDVPVGYVDKATWACSSPYIVFETKDEAGAIIHISQAFSDKAIIELLFVEKYYDQKGFTRANTYYKTFEIYCKGGGTGNDDGDDSTATEITGVPANLELEVGESQTITPSINGQTAGFSIMFTSQKPKNFTRVETNYKTGITTITGMMPGTGTLQIKTKEGAEANCKITVKDFPAPADPAESGIDRKTVIREMKRLIKINHSFKTNQQSAQ